MLRREIVLAHFPRLTFKRQQELLSYAGSFDSAWNLKSEDLKKIGWKEDLINNFQNWKRNLNEDSLEKILNLEKISCYTKNDSSYPALLKEIYDPPLCLFVRGNLKNTNFPIAVVGPRKFSPYGKIIAQDFASQLSRNNISVVSGLAIGIDAIAHHATLAAKGHTVAVLGGGCNKQHIQPSSHSVLAESIIENEGAIVSEYPPGTVPNKFTFPRRNRIIAGMSLGTLVIEAGANSGALITAQSALDSGREVFVIPQNITSQSSVGSNNLLKMGAKPVTSVEDILESLNLQNNQHYVKNKEIIPDSPIEAILLSHISNEPVHVDELIKKSNMESSVVNSTLTIMEMKGNVRNLGGMKYTLSR